MQYAYDMLGNRVYQVSMEAGTRWMLNDVAGSAIRSWDSRGHAFRTEYDPLRRPAQQFVRGSDPAQSDPRTFDKEILFEQTGYGEGQVNDTDLNLRTRVVKQYDCAGVVTNERYDFKGNLLSGNRQLATDYQNIPDWSLTVALETEGGMPKTYATETSYDALNRPLTQRTPDNSVIHYGYNEAKLLEEVNANLHGAISNGQPEWTPFVVNIDYDAKGQRRRIDYGNGVSTFYEYDPLTFRLVHILTRRDATAFPGDCLKPHPVGWPGCQLQNLHYTYDPVGNITHIWDVAQQTLYFKNQRVEPSAEYTYDAIYRMIEASGREHLGQVGGAPIRHSYNDVARIGLLHPGDGNAMGRYLERYVYDAVGNFLSMQHLGSEPTNGWNRAYTYSEPSQLESGKQSNRLTSTMIGDTTEPYSTLGDGYDEHGNMLRMPHLQLMQWDFKDQLQITQRQAVDTSDIDGVQQQGERTWYVYDSTGQRVRKITELANGKVKDERIYLSGFEIYRKHGTNSLVRETLHIMDDKQRVALVESRTEGVESGVPARLIRYQFGNHLGSASLELDDQAQIISYEEYTPYGSTSYQAVRSQTEMAKRYRFTGKERDEESGLYYFGLRSYLPWLARWISPDPIGLSDGANLYEFTRSNPVNLQDREGTSVCNEDDLLCSIGEAIAGESDNPVLRGITDQLAERGVAIANVPQVIARKYEEEGLVGVGEMMLVGAHQTVQGTGEAFGDLYYTAIHGEIGSETEQELAKQATEGFLGAADVVTMVKGGAASTRKAAAASRKAVAKAYRATIKPKGGSGTSARSVKEVAVRPAKTKSMVKAATDSSSKVKGVSKKAGSSSAARRRGRRWKVGDPHDAPTGSGKESAWSTVRQRYWKNRAASAKPGEFTLEDLARMKRGRAPKDPITGKSIELEHVKPQRTKAAGRHRDLLEVTPLVYAAPNPGLFAAVEL